MSQSTLVLKVPPSEHARLRDRLAGASFEFRTVPHAAFSARGEGVVVTLYNSGKLVVQGPDPQVFVARYTDLDPTVQSAAERAPNTNIARLDGPTIGSDETGKGDYFGPLVVAAAYVEPDDVAELRKAGVADSKRLSDDRALLLGAWLRSRLPFSVQRLDPYEYNARYKKFKTLNPLLADLHARAIRALVEEADAAGVRVIVDQFARESVMRKALGKTDVELEQAPRAEANIAVAAASIIARQEFLIALRELSEEYGVELHKGAGAPVDRVGREFLRTHGARLLGRVAKLHFKNTDKIGGRVSP